MSMTYFIFSAIGRGTGEKHTKYHSKSAKNAKNRTRFVIPFAMGYPGAYKCCYYRLHYLKKLYTSCREAPRPVCGERAKWVLARARVQYEFFELHSSSNDLQRSFTLASSSLHSFRSPPPPSIPTHPVQLRVGRISYFLLIFAFLALSHRPIHHGRLQTPPPASPSTLSSPSTPTPFPTKPPSPHHTQDPRRRIKNVGMEGAAWDSRKGG